MQAGDADRYNESDSVITFKGTLVITVWMHGGSIFLYNLNIYYSNGAVCGALAGCVVGFKALPEDLLQFPHRDWLDQQVDTFLTTVGLT